jgi:16S rRNA C967 or C1407 C5-methylase (RsmB/RsmF family)
LIEAAAGMVCPGGILVYSTCSFAPEENEMVVDQLLRKFHNIAVEPIEHGSDGLTSFGDIKFDSQLKNTRRLYPHIHDTTGFFIAKMRVS